MSCTTLLATPALLAALICMPAPAGAGQRGGHSRGGGGGGGNVGRAAPRAGAPRMMGSQQSFGSPRVGQFAPRAVGPRSFGSRGFAVRSSVVVGHASPRFVGHVNHVGVVGHVGHVGVVAPFRYGHPYYAFRPHVSLGFGLWVGYPVAYPYASFGVGYGYGYPYPYAYSSAYPYPYPYSYPYPAAAYGYPQSGYPQSGYPPANYPAQPQGSVGVQPGQNDSGGVSFEITPNTAAVYVDGQYVGTVANFGPTLAPLALTPGRHHLEVRSAGYQTMSFDADVTAGQVVPFRGTMQPIR